jgi:hypothetical protein
MKMWSYGSPAFGEAGPPRLLRQLKAVDSRSGVGSCPHSKVVALGVSAGGRVLWSVGKSSVSLWSTHSKSVCMQQGASGRVAAGHAAILSHAALPDRLLQTASTSAASATAAVQTRLETEQQQQQQQQQACGQATPPPTQRSWLGLGRD